MNQTTLLERNVVRELVVAKTVKSLYLDVCVLLGYSHLEMLEVFVRNHADAYEVTDYERLDVGGFNILRITTKDGEALAEAIKTSVIGGVDNVYQVHMMGTPFKNIQIFARYCPVFGYKITHMGDERTGNSSKGSFLLLRASDLKKS